MYLSAATSTRGLIKSPTFCREKCKTPRSSELFCRVTQFITHTILGGDVGEQLSLPALQRACSKALRRPVKEDRAGLAKPPCPAHSPPCPQAASGPVLSPLGGQGQGPVLRKHREQPRRVCISRRKARAQGRPLAGMPHGVTDSSGCFSPQQSEHPQLSSRAHAACLTCQNLESEFNTHSLGCPGGSLD